MTDTVTLRIRSFEGQILYFNGMYKLPVAPYPSLKKEHLGEYPAQRLGKFKATILKEVGEVDAIIQTLQTREVSDEDILTDIADWLGDITVYCASEAAKFGIPMREVLRVIMQSNFSKLQADGTVKYDENGKVEKGPGYWKPEPIIRDIITDIIKDAENGRTENLADSQGNTGES